jgi:hypothetical protein
MAVLEHHVEKEYSACPVKGAVAPNGGSARASYASGGGGASRVPGIAGAQVQPAGTVLDEHQDVQSLEEHGVHVQEVDGEDPSGLACRNCLY